MGESILKKFILTGIVLLGSTSDAFSHEEGGYTAFRGSNIYNKERIINRYPTTDSYNFLNKYSDNENGNTHILKKDNSYYPRAISNRLNTIDSTHSSIDNIDNSYDFLKEYPDTINRNKSYITVKAGAYIPGKQNIDIKGIADDVTGNLDKGINYGIGIGKEFNSWRFEGSITRHNSKLDSIRYDGIELHADPEPKVHVDSYLMSVYRDFGDFDSNISPYLGFGAGFSHVEVATSVFNLNGTSTTIYNSKNFIPTLNLTGGITFDISEKSSFFTETSMDILAPYTFTYEGQDINFKSMQALNFMTGVKFRF